MTGERILFERRGAAGLVTLNRPQALNAVTHAMVLALRAQLDRWADDPAITRVVIQAAGDRAFSAGGDIRHLYDLGVAGKREEALQFWRDEYPLNAVIKNYRKPYVALIDGIVMGGGVGVSVHGSHRVAGDRYSFAMPEVGIGFFPDVGATWFLPRLPGELGTYCALTGERFGRRRRGRRRPCHPSHPLGALSGAARRACRHGLGRCDAGGLQRAGRRGADPGAARDDRPAVRRNERRGHPRRARARSRFKRRRRRLGRQDRRHHTGQIAAQPENRAGAGARAAALAISQRACAPNSA